MKSSEEEDKTKIKPFKLSFADKKLQGRSNVRIDRPLDLPDTVATKFYAKYSEDEHHNDIVNKYLEKLKVYGPRERLCNPVTENQKYGWYQVFLTDADRKDRRLNFHKRTDVIVREHLMNYAKIRG